MTDLKATAPGSSSSANVQEFKIRVPKNVKKKYHVMRFNATLNVDFAKWTHVKMERENNIKEFKGIEEDMPKFGAGSEYGRDMREEARRKKFGIISRKYKPEDQPWILKVGGKTGKKFKGIREGGVSENAAYYVFTHAADGAIDAYPLQEWYNFQPIQRYKALSAEEAEHEFGRRNKVINYFSLMLRKRMLGDGAPDDGDDPDEKKTKGSKAKKDLKISEMDEWIDSDDDSSDSEGGEKEKDEEEAAAKKKKNKKALKNKKKKKVEDEAFEDSDDGDEEGREKDYISDSSESESDHETKTNKELKGVAEEDALRKLLTSDEDSDEEQEQKQESEQEDEPTKEGEERASKLTKKKKKPDETKKDSSSEFSSDSDTDPESSNKKTKKSKNGTDKNPGGASGSGSANTSRAGTPTPTAAMAAVAAANAANANQPPSKRPKLDPSYIECGVTEEAVRRYLARKPMTTTELLTKFKSKRTGVSSERLVETMTQILKRINPVKQNINGKMYLSIKPS
ncbi:general transcription factor IIF subunit 1 [Maniola hyperantus]|uniref:general transcription factor IIF subunit 1 n=1 Tax=Aphantopus hyperantus TaxID=2795564 RepID=UPI0015696756|nr:general transcription factor IIF subunit 1 isoform X2 [Maniola hyperantus]